MFKREINYLNEKFIIYQNKKHYTLIISDKNNELKSKYNIYGNKLKLFILLKCSDIECDEKGKINKITHNFVVVIPNSKTHKNHCYIKDYSDINLF